MSSSHGLGDRMHQRAIEMLLKRFEDKIVAIETRRQTLASATKAYEALREELEL